METPVLGTFWRDKMGLTVQIICYQENALRYIIIDKTIGSHQTRTLFTTNIRWFYSTYSPFCIKRIKNENSKTNKNRT